MSLKSTIKMNTAYLERSAPYVPQTDYGEPVTVEIVHHNIEAYDPSSITIEIGGWMLTPTQIEHIIATCDDYKRGVIAYLNK